MHVDGFRFDLAPVLIRGIEERRSSFFEVVQQDPVLSQVKLIAEPWDVGPDGQQLGKFPPGWAEWNGAFRDCVRRFWRGDPGQVPELATRLTGSSDLYAPSGRRTYASVNFVTCHDGFCLSDLVSFEHKHNEANGNDNTDGTDENYSRNWGVEGPTESVRIERMRDRMKRNMLATTFFSQGVRMLLSGDEIGHSRQGNNNPYCQDNGLNWLNWDLDEPAIELFDFTRQLCTIVQANPVLRRRDFFTGKTVSPGGMRDVTWVRPDGEEMTDSDWSNRETRTIGMLLAGRAADEVDDRGRAVFGQSLLLLLNGGTRSRLYVLPKLEWPGMWEELLNTSRPGTRVVRAPTVNLTAHSLILLRYDQRIEVTARA
jgi:isoamylase